MPLVQIKESAGFQPGTIKKIIVEAASCAVILLFCLLAAPVVFGYDVYKWIKERLTD